MASKADKMIENRLKKIGNILRGEETEKVSLVKGTYLEGKMV